MNTQLFLATRAILTLCVVASALIVLPAVADQPAANRQFKVPHTEHGYPDLQGVWTNATITPLQRPDKYGDRRVHTKEEAKALEQDIADANTESDKPTASNATVQDLNKSCELRGFGNGASCAYNNFWTDSGTKLIELNGEKRSSIIVDPANGKIPALLPAAQVRNSEQRARFRNAGAFDGPETRPLGERCIMSFGSSAGPPMLPLLYNNNYQIVQTQDAVTILVEMVHDARVIRINGKPLPRSIRKWMGDSVGHYDGDTLVVETTNFHQLNPFQGASENRKVTERFTRIARNKILYRFTVNDPTSYAQPFSGELALNAAQGNIYEYACHEGNYALPGVLAGERAAERSANAGKQ